MDNDSRYLRSYLPEQYIHFHYNCVKDVNTGQDSILYLSLILILQNLVLLKR